MRVAIVGGHNQDTYEKLLKKIGRVDIHFYDGIPKKINRRKLETLIKGVDYVIIIQSAPACGTQRKQQKGRANL